MTNGKALITGLALALSSCGDPNALSEDRIPEIVAAKVRFNPCVEFQRDISMASAYVNGAPIAMREFLQANDPLPITIPVFGLNGTPPPPYGDFEALGLLASQPVEGAHEYMASGLRRYDLTPLGRSIYQVGEKKDSSDRPPRKNPLLCPGKGQVAEVVNFVVPAGGQNSTTVTYRWNTVDTNGNVLTTLPDQPWAGIGNNPSRRPQLEGEETATLTLTNNGWEVLAQ